MQVYAEPEGEDASELTMTPKLRLKAQAWNSVLSCILKLRYLGKMRTTSSTKMMQEPRTHAESIVSQLLYFGHSDCFAHLPAPLTKAKTHPLVSLSISPESILEGGMAQTRDIGRPSLDYSHDPGDLGLRGCGAATDVVEIGWNVVADLRLAGGARPLFADEASCGNPPSLRQAFSREGTKQARTGDVQRTQVNYRKRLLGFNGF